MRPSRFYSFLCVTFLLAVSCGDSSRSASVDCSRPEAECTLREVADAAGVRIGAGAAIASLLDEDPAYSLMMARHFNALTPNAELKWQAIQSLRGKRDFSGADQLVEFALGQGMQVRGHTLVWANQDFYDVLPAYVDAITDAAELREVTREHIQLVMERYRGRIRRYDVVNEPLALGGEDLHDNVYRELLGDDWVVEVFRMAREADPEAELWLNETFVLNSSVKIEALYRLVSDMLAAGAPLDGVGFQGHFLGGAPDPEVVEAAVRRFGNLGLRVALTEVDIPMPAGGDGASAQRRSYFETLAACLRVPACEEITFWGFTDRYTWLDDFLGYKTYPMPLDEDYEEKPAYQGIREALLERMSAGRQ